jgi:hypothetical protein
MVSLFITASIVIAIPVFLRWDPIENKFNKWTPMDIQPIGLLQFNGGVIVGVLFLLSLITSKDTAISDLSVWGIYIGPQHVKSLIAGLTASVVSQFAISTTFLSLFGNATKEEIQSFRQQSGATSSPSNSSPWGYKLALLFNLPGFATLILTMIVIGVAGLVYE